MIKKKISLLSLVDQPGLVPLSWPSLVTKTRHRWHSRHSWEKLLGFKNILNAYVMLESTSFKSFKFCYALHHLYIILTGYIITCDFQTSAASLSLSTKNYLETVLYPSWLQTLQRITCEPMLDFFPLIGQYRTFCLLSLMLKGREIISVSVSTNQQEVYMTEQLGPNSLIHCSQSLSQTNSHTWHRTFICLLYGWHVHHQSDPVSLPSTLTLAIWLI